MASTTHESSKPPSTSQTQTHLSSPKLLESQLPKPVDGIPDGGFGWVIVASCSVFTFFYVGLSYSWGVIQARLAGEALGPPSTLAFIGSTAASFVSFGAIANTHILRLLGTRSAALLASVMLSFGQILSGWTAQSIGGLFITSGVIMGFGTSLSFMACGTLPAQYFQKRLGLANGFIYAGGGIGGCVLSISMDDLIDRVGIPWTFRILGFVTIVATVPAALLLKERIPRPTISIDWSLFHDPKFCLLFFSSGLAAFPILVPPFFIPLYAESLGMSSRLASVLVAIFNISSALGRVGFGFLSDVIGPVTSLTLSLIFSALSLLILWPISTSLVPLIIFTIFIGMGNGGFFSTIPSIVGRIYGPSCVGTALAMIVSAWAGGYLLGAPISGWILDRYGGSAAGPAAFRPSMYFVGSMSLAGALLAITIRRLINRKFFAFS